jgi:hypothetical protein
MTINNLRSDIPRVSRDQEITRTHFPDFIKSWDGGALIGGLVALAILCVLSVISYFNYGELIHFPWGNGGEGYHWPENNHGIWPMIKEKVQIISDEVKSKF